jgi:peptidylprolyl isomerase
MIACGGLEETGSPARRPSSTSSSFDGPPVSGPTVTTEELTTGSGARVHRGNKVAVVYTMKLADGTVVDEVGDRSKPLSFIVGSGEVIRGWEQGLEGMAANGKRRIVVPAGLAYGEVGRPPRIPPGATLTIEVELLEITEIAPPAASSAPEPTEHRAPRGGGRRF